VGTVTSGPSDFGKFLREARAIKRWSVDDLSRYSGVSASLIEGIESGRVRSADQAIQQKLGSVLRPAAPQPSPAATAIYPAPPVYQGSYAAPNYPIQAQGKTETMVREYTDSAAFNRDAARLAKDGWSVISTTDVKQRAGCGRLILLWWLVLLRPPKAKIVVTYQRTR